MSAENLSFLKSSKNLIILLPVALAGFSVIKSKSKAREKYTRSNYETYSAFVDVQTLHTKNEPLEDGQFQISPEVNFRNHFTILEKENI